MGNRRTGPRWQRDSTTLRHDQITPSSVSCADSFPPRGSLRYVRGNHDGSVLKEHLTVRKEKTFTGLANAFPWGGRWAGPVGAGSDEGERWEFLGVSNRRTGPRWLQDSTTLRHDQIVPSSVTCGDSFGLHRAVRGRILASQRKIRYDILKTPCPNWA